MQWLVLICAACRLPGADGPPPAPGPLVFAQTSQAFRPRFADAQVEAVYAFTNTGAAPVTILGTSTSCGCTTAALSKAVFQPGESGQITATFVFGDRYGPQRKVVHVATDAPDQRKVDLTLLVELPSGPLLDPPIRYWKVGEALTAKPVTVTVPADSPYRIVAASTHSRLFTMTATVSADGRRVDLMITPTQSARAVGMSVDLQAVSGEPVTSRTFQAYACVAADIPASASPMPEPTP
ncbi:MAG: DUF1573 domain-containing protein [Planctomycetes bacterium]|nr:DUF1573 domain-containing protein [Planctomycetota bacterium]